MKAFILIYKGFLATQLSAFNYIHPAVDIVYVALGDDAPPYDGAISLQEALATSFDILYLPGGSTPALSKDIISGITRLVKDTTHVLATEEGTLILAHTGEIDNAIVAISSELSGAAKEQFPGIRWEHRGFFRSGKFFSADSTHLRTLGLLFSASLNNHLSDTYPLTQPLGCPPSTQCDQSEEAETPGQATARQIAASESEPEAVNEVVLFAARVAAYGFVGEANRLMLELFPSFPNALGEIEPAIQYGLEFIWAESGDRPLLPWNQPSPEELEEWYIGHRGIYPQSEQEKVIALETLECRIDLGDVEPHPYSLHVAAVLALELGRTELAERYIELLAAYTTRMNRPHLWPSLLKWKPLIPYWVRGILAQKTGTTHASILSQVNHVIAAIAEWRTTQADQQSKTDTRQKELAKLPCATLIQILEPLKWDGDDALARPPATVAQVAEAEARLGVSLPEDYKEFLRTSNGSGYIPNLAKPALKGVESLKWEDSKDLGVDGLPLDLGLQFDPDKVERLPRMGRVISVSSGEDCEEYVWLVEPSQVKAALDAQPAGYTINEEPGWRIAYWIPWIPQLKWHTSFRQYLESLVLQAEESESSDT
ncbi:hypothetical protein AX16_005856 [Volvariella volvacea WC 439]|nr:hypothetical protein AX16_005856 [Volvariella volvacea WC 439]